jgi:hypothetical protein
MKHLLLFGLFLLLPVAVQAQNTSGSLANHDNDPARSYSEETGPYGQTASTATRSVTGRVMQVFQSDHALTLVRKNGKQVRFVVNSRTRLRADKQTDLADRKTLTLTDFKPGQTVKITYYTDSGSVTEMRLRRPKN